MNQIDIIQIDILLKVIGAAIVLGIGILGAYMKTYVVRPLENIEKHLSVLNGRTAIVETEIKNMKENYYEKTVHSHPRG